MPTLPIPAFGAIVLIYLMLRTLWAEGARLHAPLLGLAALQLSGVALVHGYGVTLLQPILPVMAAAIPPLAWITFRAALFRSPDRAQIALHLLAPAFTLFCRLFAPATLDAIVPGVFAVYGCAILWQVRSSGDMPLARIEAGGLPARIWAVLGCVLILSAMTDLLIAAAYAIGRPDWVGPLIGLSSTVPFLAIGLLTSAPSATDAAPEAEAEAQAPAAAETEGEDGELLRRLDGFLAREKAHLDPNLTLARLARRLHLPEKRLSAAVNRATGMNLSRYINGWRIRHACGLIEGDKSVTSAMLESGFNTKSNFNREFLRETGTTPSKWRRSAAACPSR